MGLRSPISRRPPFEVCKEYIFFRANSKFREALVRFARQLDWRLRNRVLPALRSDPPAQGKFPSILFLTRVQACKNLRESASCTAE